MTFPTIVLNDDKLAEAAATQDWLQTRVEAFRTTLASSGAILFRGFPITSAEDFDAFAAVFGYGEFTYQESLSNAVRINLTPRVFTANEAPPDVEIFLHHEMAQTPVSPEKIFFCCLSAAEEGGATPLCRSDQVYAALVSEEPTWATKFKKKGLKYTTHMPAADDADSGQGRSWCSTLSAATVMDAEQKLKTLGYSWQWQPDGSLLTTTPVLPAVKELPDGSASFFNQVIAAGKGWKRLDATGKPVLTLGDGEPIPEDVLTMLSEIADCFTYPLQWQQGDVALVDNHRVMHGRYPFSGKRKRQVVVCLAREAA